MISIASMLYQTATWSGVPHWLTIWSLLGAPRFVAAVFVCSVACCWQSRTAPFSPGVALHESDLMGRLATYLARSEPLESCRYRLGTVGRRSRPLQRARSWASPGSGSTRRRRLTISRQVVPTRGGVTSRGARPTARPARSPSTRRRSSSSSDTARRRSRGRRGDVYEDHDLISAASSVVSSTRRGSRRRSGSTARPPASVQAGCTTSVTPRDAPAHPRRPVHIVEARLGHASPVRPCSRMRTCSRGPTSRRPRSWPRYSLVSKQFAESPQTRWLSGNPRRAGSRRRRSPRPTRRRRRS